ncbi:MAG: patatin-like phospholipase family protein, partial [Bacteroidota bacterium]
GYSVEQLEELAVELDWEEYFSDQLLRYYIPMEERESSDRYQVQFPLDGKKIQLPKGVLGGQNIHLLLSRLAMPAQQYKDFDQFPIPFRCVATDFETGEAVVLSKGSLADAMRASMSIPSVFEPIEMDGKLLIDGMAIRNLPVQDVRDMGADVIIAVDVGAPLYKKEDLTSIFVMLEQTGSYRMFDVNEEQLKMADVIIRPAIKNFGSLDFTKADSLIEVGEVAAREALPELRKLFPQIFRTGLERPGLAKIDEVKIDSVEILGLDTKNTKVIKRLLQVRKGRKYSLERLERRIERLSGSQFIKSANYQLLPLDSSYLLRVVAVGQSGNFLKVSANYDSNLKAGLLLNATLRNLLLNGTRLSIDFKLSENPLLKAEYLLYTSSRPNLGINLVGRTHYYPAFFYQGGDRTETFQLHHHEGRFELLSVFKGRWLGALGIGWERFLQTEAIFDSDAQDARLHQGSFFLRFSRDTYDRLNFPHEGSYSRLLGKLSFDGSFKSFDDGNTQRFDRWNVFLRAQMSKLFPIGNRFALHWYNDAGVVSFSEDNFLNLFYLGRNLPGEWSQVYFAGLDLMERPASSYALSGMKFRMEPSRDYFISLMVNYGYFDVDTFVFNGSGMATQFEADSGSLLGTAVELGMMTRVGPALFRSEFNLLDPRVNFVVHLGYVF